MVWPNLPAVAAQVADLVVEPVKAVVVPVAATDPVALIHVSSQRIRSGSIH